MKLNKYRNKLTAYVIFLCIISSCNNITQVDPAKTSSRSITNFANTGEALIYRDNPTELVGTTFINGSSNLIGYLNSAYSEDLERDFVTNNNFLETKCSFTQYTSSTTTTTDSADQSCFLVLNDDLSSTQAIQSNDGSWNYEAESDEFYQVNLFYHTNKMLNRYLESLTFIHKHVHFDSNHKIAPATKWNLTDTKSYWLTKSGVPATLRAYANILMDDGDDSTPIDLNAYFSPATNSIGFGYNDDQISRLKMVQDPTVIYHELGHTLVKIMMNQRNVTSTMGNIDSLEFESDLGVAFYDEAGAINEGIADYFSYFMLNRKKVGDWAFSTILNGHRPLSEDDDFHTANVSSNTGEKLSYPQYVYYNPNFTSVNEEDNHNSGQIVTHYLVNLSETLKNTCSFQSSDSEEIHKQVGSYILLLLNETLAEVGDLTSKGSDYFSEKAGSQNQNHESIFFTNLNPEYSFLWAHYVNPPTFRKFFRIFSKNLKHYISDELCQNFSIDQSEELLDEYGLLLFKSYEDKGSGYDLGNIFTNKNDYVSSTGSSTDYFNFTFPFNEAYVYAGETLSPLGSNNFINENNRNQTVLVSKEFIELDSSSPALLFDGQAEIANFIASLTFEGINVTPTSGIAGTEYNNNDVKIGPGEVIGLALNIFNNSNSPMAGVQILANDWDHMRLKTTTPEVYTPDQAYINSSTNKSGLINNEISGNTAIHEPCIFDGFPLDTEGGVTDTDATVAGNCSSITKSNYKLDLSKVENNVTYPRYQLDSPQPICLIQFNDENETKWVSQDFYRKNKLDLSDNDCLNNKSMSADEFNPNECLVRVLPGASTANYARINAQSNWPETIRDGTTNSVLFNYSSLIFMEINKWIEPGTKVNCRFRARASNCKDCFNNSSGTEYQDYHYSGPLPYKIIDYQFTIKGS